MVGRAFKNVEILEALECHLSFPNLPNPKQNPLSYEYLCGQQQANQQLLAL
jgi:hypothetical protein